MGSVVSISNPELISPPVTPPVALAPLPPEQDASEVASRDALVMKPFELVIEIWLIGAFEVAKKAFEVGMNGFDKSATG